MNKQSLRPDGLKKIVFVTIILIILFIAGFNLVRNKTESLVSPSVASLPSLESSQPKEIKYDSSTDLKKELESVNPQVLDSDF